MLALVFLGSEALVFSAQLQQRSMRQPVKTETRQLALADFCQAIFALNEFIYVD